MSRSAVRWVALVALLAFLVSCTSSRDDDGGSDTTTGGAGSGETQPEATGTDGRGVTKDTIKIGYAYIDLETLAKSGIVRIDHGPYEDIITALVDDVNARGGVDGRKLELVTAKFSPIGNEEQLAACTKLTEDDQVFAVLGGLLNDNNLCITQQHGTALVGEGYLNDDRLAKSKAPWVTAGLSDERGVSGLVQLLDEGGYLKGKTVAVYSADAANRPLMELAIEELEAAGYEVADSALLDVTQGDIQAQTAGNKVYAQRFKDKGVDTVVVAGQFLPGADFDAAGFHPAFYNLSLGNIQAAAFTNPLEKFPVVAAPGNPTRPETEEFKRCKAVYEKASGVEVLTAPEEDRLGKSTGLAALTATCTTLQIFVAAAEAAGDVLNNDTFRKGIESLGEIELAGSPDASFGPGKYDGQNALAMYTYDPSYVEGSGDPPFIEDDEVVELPAKG